MRHEEQIMSREKYPSIFSPQMEAIVFITNLGEVRIDFFSEIP